MRAALTVARREVITKMTDKAFVIGSILLTAIIAGVFVIQSILAGGATEVRLAVTPEARDIAATVVQQAGSGEDLVVTITEVPDAAAGRAALAADTADAWLHAEGSGWRVAASGLPDPELLSAVDTAVRGPSSVTPEIVGGADEQSSMIADVVSFAIAFLFYISSLVFGMTLANSVVEEKQSRIVEIIATKIPVRALLAGKVIGNTVLAVGQMALYAGVGLVGLSLSSYAAYLPAVSGPVAWFIAFFLVGFVLLASMWAVAGSLASRTEDVQATGTPVTLLILAVFFGSAFISGVWETVLSFVPPFSAVIMPARLLNGTAQWWEAALALALLVVAAGLVVLAAERLYKRALLQTQGRVSVTSAWSARL